MALTLGAREARRRFSELLGRVGFAGEYVIVQRSGRPMAAMVPVEVYERLIAERAARFEVLDRIRERLPDVPSQEVIDDVDRAVAEARAERAASGS